MPMLNSCYSQSYLHIYAYIPHMNPYGHHVEIHQERRMTKKLELGLISLE